MPAISVVYTCACTRCGTTNVQENREADKDYFEQMTKLHPSVYWKEDQSKGVVYRQHEEASEGNCRTSC